MRNSLKENGVAPTILKHLFFFLAASILQLFRSVFQNNTFSYGQLIEADTHFSFLISSNDAYSTKSNQIEIDLAFRIPKNSGDKTKRLLYPQISTTFAN